MNDAARRTDRELFQAGTAGESQALAELASRHASGLFDFALRGTLDEQQASAVVESALRRVQEPGAQMPNQIDFRTWLYSLGLIDVLAVSSEARTARISTEDERFYQAAGDIETELAHWAWQAARGLRTRDYCVLDLTLRRGLTPEQVAEAASLTRSNLYGSIGRARGAFEETFAAMVLFERGRDACPVLDEMVEGSPGSGLRPALRHQIIEHAEDCEACRRTLDSLPAASTVFIALEDIEVPSALVAGTLGGAGAASRPAGPGPTREETLPAPPIGAAAAVLAAEPEGDELQGADSEFDEDFDDEDEEDDVAVTPAAAVTLAAGPAIATADRPRATASPEPRPRPAPAAPYRHQDEGGNRFAAILTQGGPIAWTYVLLGVLAVMAIYLGVAVADSLQGGGSDSGAVPLDSAANGLSGRTIDCGGGALELDEGTSTVVSFDENALDGYQIRSISYVPVSEDAAFEDLEGTLENPFLIRLTAQAQDASAPRTEEFELRIEWQREGGEPANSLCPLLVHVATP